MIGKEMMIVRAHNILMPEYINKSLNLAVNHKINKKIRKIIKN